MEVSCVEHLFFLDEENPLSGVSQYSTVHFCKEYGVDQVFSLSVFPMYCSKNVGQHSMVTQYSYLQT